MIRSVKPGFLVFVLMIIVLSWGCVSLIAQPVLNPQKNNQADKLIMSADQQMFGTFDSVDNWIEKNVVAALSRETLGGMNLVDFLPIYKSSDDGVYSYFNYNVTVRNNFIDSY